MAQTMASQVRETARRHAPDFYIAALLAPGYARERLLTIAALAGEIGRIPLEVSEPMLAEIRLQWWRDTISGATPSGHPVADEAIRQGLNAPRLLAIADAGEPESSAIATFAAAAAILGADPRSEAVTAAAGAYAAARELALRAAQGTPSEAGRREAVRHNLQSARAALRHAPAAIVPAILPAALVEPYLRVSQLGADGARRHLATLLPLQRVARLGLARALGRI